MKIKPKYFFFNWIPYFDRRVWSLCIVGVFIVKVNDVVWAIEVKSGSVFSTDLAGLHSFSKYYKGKHQKAVATMADVPRKLEDIRVLPWQQLLKLMGL